ncbi:hypothetical protein [Bradyrhizobium sp. CCBAU 45394]|uniref:hypothetical protein n=1 Tax=Bradyrhizobium sp. CCBAU 45394 TaxID=1325087 RepID=UPI002304680D|nr:hypothetical protein [Bradyrhizobium sp. CCBAU 45394]
MFNFAASAALFGRNGEGLALFDPHGDLALAALSHVPKRRSNILVYVDPANRDWPIGFNPLADDRALQGYRRRVGRTRRRIPAAISQLLLK